MNVLALDTSTELCSVAVARDAELFVDARAAGQTHSQILLPMVDALLRRAGLRVGQLDGIAFGEGPGSFTGLRIACGVAQGLALGAAVPTIGVGSLIAIAHAAGCERAICCLDARMHEVYHAAYVRVGDSWVAVSEPGLYAPAQVPVPDEGGWTGCGNGFSAYARALEQRLGGALTATMPELAPHAREIALLGSVGLARGRGKAPEHALPVYVRNKVALTVAEQR